MTGCMPSAPTLLALIGNLGQVQWTYAAPDGTAVTRSVTLEEVDAALPDWIAAYDLDAGADWTAPESVKDYRRLPGGGAAAPGADGLRLLRGHRGGRDQRLHPLAVNTPL